MRQLIALLFGELAVPALVLAVAMTAARTHAADWGGPFALIPVSAPEMRLDAVLPGTAEGNAVSIGKPTGADNQVWVVALKEQGAYALRPAASKGRVLGVCLGGADGNTLFAFCGDKILKRAVKLHGMGAWSPRIAVRGSPL